MVLNPPTELSESPTSSTASSTTNPNPSLKSCAANTLHRIITLPLCPSRNGTPSPETDSPTLSNLSYLVDTSITHRRLRAWVPVGAKGLGCRPLPLPVTRARLPRMVMKDPSRPSHRTILTRPMPTRSRKLPRRMSTRHRPESSRVLYPTVSAPSRPQPKSPSPLPIPTCSIPNDLHCLPSLVTHVTTSRTQDGYQTRRL